MEYGDRFAVKKITIESQTTHVPDDWKLGKLADFGVFRSGNGFPLAFQGHQSGDFPFFKVSDLSGEGNQLFMNNANHYISEGVRKKLGAIRFEPGSIVFAKIGAAIFLERKRLLTQESCLDNNMMAFTLTDEFACPRFFHYLFQRIEIGKLVSSTALPALSGQHVGAVSLLIPPPEEQRAIAEVLSDVDGLINALDALIAKKRAIKQATMQQLLTGKTRLPGFSGAWKTKRLGDVAHIQTGSKNNENKDDNGEYPLYVRSAVVERINSYCFDGEAILVPGEGGIENIFHYINGRFDCHQRVYMINRFVDDVFGKLIYYIMVLQFGKHAMQNTVKATVDSLRLPTFQTFTFSIPKDIEEQRAIAEVLSDMDAEIAALERRRDKTVAIKQGMMQQLLTGRVRLSESRVIADGTDAAD